MVMVDFDRIERAQNFKEELNNTFESIWDDKPFELAFINERACEVQTTHRINLSKNDEVSLFGYFRFNIDLDDVFQERLSVHKSSFRFFEGAASRQLFEYNFNRDREDTPRAYLRIHLPETESFSSLMSKNEQGIPVIEFPLGGDLLRPCLEDVLLSCNQGFSIGLTDEDKSTLLEEIKKFRSLHKDIIKNEHKEMMRRSSKEFVKRTSI